MGYLVARAGHQGRVVCVHEHGRARRGAVALARAQGDVRVVAEIGAGEAVIQEQDQVVRVRRAESGGERHVLGRDRYPHREAPHHGVIHVRAADDPVVNEDLRGGGVRPVEDEGGGRAGVQGDEIDGVVARRRLRALDRQPLQDGVGVERDVGGGRRAPVHGDASVKRLLHDRAPISAEAEREDRVPVRVGVGRLVGRPQEERPGKDAVEGGAEVIGLLAGRGGSGDRPLLDDDAHGRYLGATSRQDWVAEFQRCPITFTKVAGPMMGSLPL